MKKSDIEKYLEEDRKYQEFHGRWYIKILDPLKEKFWWPIERLIQKIIDIPNEIKYFLQRGFRGYSERDLWSIDWYVSSWMPQAIRELRKGDIGYPCYKGMYLKRWKEILKKIENGFLADMRLKEFEYNTKDQKTFRRLLKVRNKGLQLFVKYYDGLWD